ncbi:MAG: type II secretion system F family protein [Thermodesulfobacteriota bacterium]
MPVYHYTAYTAAGRQTTGIVDAESGRAALQKLRGLGVYPLSIEERRDEDAAGGSAAMHFFSSRPSRDEVHGATRQLATLLGAGIPLVAALQGLQQQKLSHAFRPVLARIKEIVREGKPFSLALSSYPRIFSEVYVSMVRAAEASGSLDVVLERLADLGEHQQLVRNRVLAALIYPIFMTVIGTCILLGLLMYVVPGVTEMFAEMGHALPWPTVFLIRLSGFAQRWWWLLPLIVLTSILAVSYLRRLPAGRMMLDRMVLAMPVVGGLRQGLALGRFARTAAGLLESGVPLLQVLRISRNVVAAAPIAAALDAAALEVENGRKLSASLAGSRWFPPMVIQMLAAGEKSGTLDRMFEKIARAYEQRSEAKVTALTSLLEPVMILGMGLVVGFIVMAILLPIFDMQQLIR